MTATYLYKVDSFRIYKSTAPGGILTEDPFEDGLPPPDASETPPPPPPLVPSYTTNGNLSESGGRLIFDSNNSPALLPALAGTGQTALNQQAIFNTNIDPNNTSLGLKRNHEFAAEAIFDLTIPLENQQEYGVRFTDAGGPTTPDAIVGLAVRRSTDGRVWVELTERELVVGTITIKGRLELDPGGADQIKLVLMHEADSDFVTGYFELLTGGVSSGVVNIDGQAKIFDAATPAQNFTRAAIYTTNFNIDENRPVFVHEMDAFRIERNGSNILVDNFEDGVAPPSSPGAITYGKSGHFSEVDGLLIMDSAYAVPSVVTGPESIRVMNFTALTNTQNELNGLGLKINDDFSIFGRFNLILPDEERSEYGIRLSDFTGPGTGDDVISVSVRKGTDGIVRVVLSDRNLINGTMEILGTVELTPALLSTADQIGLALHHDKDNPGVITAGFRLFENGVELPGGPYIVPGFGQIFGTDTATTADDELWTRAMAFSTGFDKNGLNVIEGIEEDDTLVGTAADETFYGHLGDDTFFGGGGVDNIFGGRGNDKVVLGGNVADYTISGSGGVISLVDNRGGSPDGTIHARSIEFFEFANRTLDASLMLTREIELVGAGNNVIDDNDLTPDAADGTAFGIVNAGSTQSQVFTINNLGGQPLTIANFKVPSGFILVAPPPPVVAPGGTATFEVRVDTAKLGPKSGQITFLTNDPTGGENNYNFAISATVVAPEIDIFGNDRPIPDNAKKGVVTNHTDFGPGIGLDDAGIERVFTIRNNGTGDLDISAMNVSGPFTLLDDLSGTTIAAGASATFRVQLDTSVAGNVTGTVTILNNDANEGVYDFALSARIGPRNIVGDDTLDDTFAATADPEAFDGRGGNDTVSYAGAGAGVIASLLKSTGNTGFAAGDTYMSIENLTGSDFNDRLTGDKGNNVLEGGEGADYLDGGAGIDTASYANASAGVFASLLNPADNAGEANGDFYRLIENLRGSAFNDTLVGDKKANAIDGGDGNDEIVGGGGADILTGGAGFDVFSYFFSNEGGDTITDFTIGEDKIGIRKIGFNINPAVDLDTGDAFDFENHYFVKAVGTPSSKGNPGIVATESEHGQFLFNETDTTLWWDPDGSGKGKAVLIANLSGIILTAEDFLLL